MYLKKIYDFGNVIQIEKCFPGNYGAPGMPRRKKKKRTPEEIKRQNQANRWKRVQRIILKNFKEGDWHLILKYLPGKRPETYEEAVKQRKKFISVMRKAYKKAGLPFKWIGVTERGKKARALHHHLIIEDVTKDNLVTVQLVKKLWVYGNVQFVELYEDGEYEKLAEYIVKTETKEERPWATYSRSRNLVMPKPRKEKINRRRWRKDPVAPKGWYVVKDSVWNGMNPFTGYPYQHYTIKKLVSIGKDKYRKGGGSSG